MEEEINLKEILKGIWKRKLIIIIITIISLICGILYTSKNVEISKISNSEREILARTSFTVIQTENYQINENTANTYIKILKSNENMKKIIKNFELDMSPKELSSGIWIRRIDYSDVIEIDITDDRLIDNATDILENLLYTINEELKNNYNISDIYVLENPIIVDDNTVKEDDIQSNNNTKKIIVITLAGFICGFVIVIGLEFVDGSIKNENQIINNLKISNLAIINSKQKEFEEEYRKIKLNLKNYKTILITSLSSDNIKNKIVQGMSNLYSKYGKKVAVVDITEEKINVYSISTNKKDNDNQIKLDNSNLVELLETEKMAETLEKLDKEFDFVLINSNNMLESVNSFMMSKFVEGTILVVEERNTKIKSLEKLINDLEKIDSKIIGTIITKK